MSKDVTIDYENEYAVITCHQYWNIDKLQNVLRDQFTKGRLDDDKQNLILDMREPEDIKYTKGFFMPIRFMVDRTYGVKSVAVLLVSDEAGAEHLDMTAKRLNKVSTQDIDVRVTHRMEDAIQMAKG